ncbi:MAG: transposase [Alphaproteobacteria bacterium]|nr:transposase [Alphaproteobacteria bacterium]
MFVMGRIAQLKIDIPHLTVRQLAAKMKVSKYAVEKALAYRGGPAKKSRAKRAVPDSIKQRRKFVYNISQRTQMIKGRKYPRFCSASAIAAQLHLEHKINATSNTVYRDLRAVGARCYIRRKVPTRDPDVHRKRLAFAKKIRKADVRRHIFSDEHVESANDYSSRIFYAKSPKDVPPRSRDKNWNVPSVMIWGAIGYNFKSSLVLFPKLDADEDGKVKGWRLTGERYRRMVLPSLLGDLHATKKPLTSWTFMQDGAKCHTAKATKDYLDRKGLQMLPNWPPHSPDLNPIENLWKSLKERVAARHTPTTQDELVAAVQHEWDELTLEEVNKYIDGFWNKIVRCRENGGKC